MTAGIISGFFLLRVHGNYWWQWASPSLDLLPTDFAFCIQMRFERKMSHFPSRSRFEQTHKQQYNASCCCCYKSRRVGRRPEGDKNFTWDNIMAHVSVSWHFISNKRMNSERTLESFCVWKSWKFLVNYPFGKTTRFHFHTGINDSGYLRKEWAHFAHKQAKVSVGENQTKGIFPSVQIEFPGRYIMLTMSNFVLENIWQFFGHFASVTSNRRRPRICCEWF